MKLKPNTYYKEVDENDNEYYIMYTGTTVVYEIAYKDKNKLLVKYDKRIKYGSIKNWQEHVHRNNYKIEEMSKGDLFLEML